MGMSLGDHGSCRIDLRFFFMQFRSCNDQRIDTYFIATSRIFIDGCFTVQHTSGRRAHGKRKSRFDREYETLHRGLASVLGISNWFMFTSIGIYISGLALYEVF